MTNSSAPQIVGVIFSTADFQRAIRMRNPPDLFELRLDALVADLSLVRRGIDKLPAPLIITARHPREGGINQLSARHRRALLDEFLSRAAYVDIELRSVRTSAAILRTARAKGVRTIISFHDFKGTPRGSKLNELARRAESLGGDLLKVATRTDKPAQLRSLFDFFEAHRQKTKLAAMGMGTLGRKARLWCARHGSLLNYAHLGISRIDGQLSVAQWRRALKQTSVSCRLS